MKPIIASREFAIGFVSMLVALSLVAVAMAFR